MSQINLEYIQVTKYYVTNKLRVYVSQQVLGDE